MATTTITTKPAHPGAKHHWRVLVNGRLVGWVQERPEEETFVGVRHGKVLGPFGSKVEAQDAVAAEVL